MVVQYIKRVHERDDATFSGRTMGKTALADHLRLPVVIRKQYLNEGWHVEDVWSIPAS